MGDKLYVVVRRDLRPGFQIAQACHGLRQFSHDHPEIDREWFEKSNFIAVLSAPDEAALQILMRRAVEMNVKFSAYREPDVDNTITAIAFEPCTESRRICASLPLALR